MGEGITAHTTTKKIANDTADESALRGPDILSLDMFGVLVSCDYRETDPFYGGQLNLDYWQNSQVAILW